MDDEFKLCWKNFQDNIASGFQNLYDRGDLVDVTLACDGKLLHAHKIVLAICSPYFQEIFTTNPCKHPIIILKDVHFNIMCELLEFMYQGVVNVKHTELQSFMKIGQLLHIKGLATNSSAASTLAEKAADKKDTPSEVVTNMCSDTKNNTNTANDTNRSERDSNSATKPSKAGEVPLVTSPASSPLPMTHPQQTKDHFALHDFHSSANLKRQADTNSDTSSFHTKKQFRRSGSHTDQMSDHTDENDRGLDHVSSEDFFLSTIPHISMVESRYDYNSVKREADHSDNSAALSSMRNSFPPSFGIDYNLYKNSSDTSVPSEFSNETLHLANDCLKNFGNHMDIPPIAPGEHWFQGKLEFMLSQRGKPLLVHDGHTFGIQYVRKDKKYWQCNLSRKFNCKARVTTTDTGEIIVTNNEHCHTEIRQHLRKDYQRNKVMMNALINLSSNRFSENLRRQSVHSLSNSLNSIHNLSALVHNSVVDAPLSLQSTKMEDAQRSLEICGSESTSSVTNLETLKTSRPPEDDDLPLDCGMKTLTNEALSRQQ